MSAGYAGSYGGYPPSYPIDGRVSPSPYGVAPSASAAPYTFNGVPVSGYAGSAGYAGSVPGAAPYVPAATPTYTLPNGQPVPAGSTVIITRQPHRARRHSTSSGHHHHRSHSRGRREDEYEYERERADRERHERDRRRWEEEERDRERYEEYSRYGGGRMGVLGSSPSGYGYGDRY